MAALNVGQWAAVAVLVERHSPNFGLAAAVDRVLVVAREKAPQPEPEKEE